MSRVVVVGSINMDIVARTAHHPQPGETVLGRALAYVPGGKGANQAVAAARAGAAVRLIGCVGQDEFGAALSSFLSTERMDTSHLHCLPDAPSGIAMIVVSDAGENSIVVVPGANQHLSADHAAQAGISAGDLVVAQLEVPLETAAAAFRTARGVGARTMLNPSPAAPITRDLFALCDIVILNEIELAAYAGRSLELTRDSLLAAVKAWRTHADQIVIVTLGGEGALAVQDDTALVQPAFPVRVVDTTGAGDCFTGVLAAALSEGQSLGAALHFASAAAALSVQTLGASASLPQRAAIEAFLRQQSAR